MNKDYYEMYHCHTELSLLDSCTKYQEYVDLAVKNGQKVLSISEHGKPMNWTEKWAACKKAALRYIHSVEISTILSVVIFHGKDRITDSATMREVFGSGAYLQWYWQRLDDESFGVISSSDTRFGDDGFTFTLSPSDVDAKITFRCELIA